MWLAVKEKSAKLIDCMWAGMTVKNPEERQLLIKAVLTCQLFPMGL